MRVEGNDERRREGIEEKGKMRGEGKE